MKSTSSGGPGIIIGSIYVTTRVRRFAHQDIIKVGSDVFVGYQAFRLKSGNLLMKPTDNDCFPVYFEFKI